MRTGNKQKVLATLAISCSLWGTPAVAVEPAAKFVAGLCERGYYDYAILYLSRIQDCPVASPEFKRALAYQQGIVLLACGKETESRVSREQIFRRAYDNLEASSDANVGTLLGAKSRVQLGNVLVEQGRMLRDYQVSPFEGVSKAELQEIAREAFNKAAEAYAAGEKSCIDALSDKQRFPIDLKPGNALWNLRHDFRGKLVQSRLLMATVLAEKARTYPQGSNDNVIMLTEAAEAYRGLYEKYRRWLAGLYARLYQGRCQQELGNSKLALTLYDDLLIHPGDVPAFRTLMTKTYISVGECYIAEKDYDTAIAKLKPWVESARGAERIANDWLAVKFQLAKAYHAQGERLMGQENLAERRAAQQQARELLRQIVVHPSKVQADAQTLLGELSKREDPAGVPKTRD